MDVPTLRAEIKTWEREFRATHGRDPTIQEIKEQPAIAAKYKLYKSLSKTSSSSSSFKPPTRSATPPPPPPPQLPASSILSKARAVKVDPPASTSNPFSPVKNRKKLTDHDLSTQRASNQSRPNPFATPSKPKRTPHTHHRSPSPDPFPPIQPLLLVPRPPLSPVADKAVTRARKRLRGDPVSPSPVKEKRQRVTSQAALSFTGRAARLHSPSVSDGDEIAADQNDTIIAATPMKPLMVRRNFKVLFDDDALSNSEKPSGNASSSRKKAISPTTAVLGMKRERSRALTPSSDEDEDWGVKPRLKSLEAAASLSVKQPQLKARTVYGKHGIPKGLVPTKDNLWSDVGPNKASQTQSSSMPPPTRTQSGSALRAPNKRALPDAMNSTDDRSVATQSGYLNIPLIPPSPPPPDSSNPSKYSGKGKAKAAPVGRKKAKLLRDAGSEGEESVEDEIQVKEIDPLAHIPQTKPYVDPDSDGEVHWRTRPRSDDLAETDSSSLDPGRFEVSLPDELQRVLAISPDAVKRDVEEEKVVRGLLYGSRETHYDPSKGGEIWDVGEDSEHADGTEEDWEGEPVPWEVGEL
ncbi:DNA replication and checkpoint protein-domain-containing protein [Fomes fomentarius]|nr:DNA replication and checkpoint protein-domain-containing protein [Fomes fomentarius]